MDVYNSLWLHLLHRLDITPSQLVMSQWPLLSDMVYSSLQKDRNTCCNALSQLLQVGGDWAAAQVVSWVISVLESEDVRMTSEDDVEIADTPPTQLWHHQWKSM